MKHEDVTVYVVSRFVIICNIMLVTHVTICCAIYCYTLYGVFKVSHNAT